MKFKEIEIQAYIWEHKDELFSMIEEPTFEADPNKLPGDYEPWELLYYQTLKEYEDSYESLKGVDIFGCEVRLPKKGENPIRMDFMGCLEGQNGFVVCELKIKKSPERQAYTELFAYANHVRSRFAPMGRRDIFYLLISPMEERIVREATISNLLYDKNRVVVLVPEVGKTIDTLKFRLWIPAKDEFGIFAKSAFAFENIDVFKISWKGASGKWSPTETGKKPTKSMIHQLNKVSHYAAQLMEANGINGFVYCSQLYPSVRDKGFLENGIAIAGVNPFKAAKTRFLYERGCNLDEAAKAPMDAFEITDAFPKLKDYNKDVSGEDYCYWLSLSWSSCLEEIAFRVEKLVNYTFGKSYHQMGYGGFTWETYQFESIEDKDCWNYDINLTGIFREIYELKIERHYKAINRYSKEQKREIMESGELEWHSIDMMYSHDHIRSFIKGLTGEDLILDRMQQGGA